jgi:DNA-binding NarL/FixJ family response regulator
MGKKILLVDDNKIMRDVLRSFLAKQPGLEVVAEAENGRTAIKLTRKFRPDLIVMDIIMPDLNGIDATRRIVEEFPGTKVIALSMHSDRQFVVGMLKAGALGYLLKDCVLEELVLAVRAVLNNQTYLSSRLENRDALESE